MIPVESENRILLKAPPQERPRKSLPKLVKSKTQVLEGRFWRNAHWQKEQEALFKPCNNVSLRLLSAERTAVAQHDFLFVPSHSIHCYTGGATEGKGSGRHRPRSLRTPPKRWWKIAKKNPELIVPATRNMLADCGHAKPRPSSAVIVHTEFK